MVATATGSSACATMSATSVIGRTSSASSTSAGTSSRSGSLRCGMKTVDRPGSLGGEQLLLDATDRQHPAVQRDLTGHADVGADLTTGGHRHQRGDHRDTGRRTVLGHRAGGHVHVDLAIQRRRVDAELLGVRADVGQRDLRGLLHHVAELTGQLQAGLTLVGPGLDVEHIAAEAGDGKAGRHAGHRRALGRLRGEPRTAEVADEIRLVDGQLGVVLTFSCSSRARANLVVALRNALASSRSNCRTPGSRV